MSFYWQFISLIDGIKIKWQISQVWSQVQGLDVSNPCNAVLIAICMTLGEEYPIIDLAFDANLRTRTNQ